MDYALLREHLGLAQRVGEFEDGVGKAIGTLGRASRPI
jgi:hypothetical protein